MTSYIVLRRRTDVDMGWYILGGVAASGPQQARKAVDDGEGEFLVVPVRNATFIKGSVEQPPPRATSVEVDPDEYIPEPTVFGQTELTGEATDEPREGTEVPADGSEHEVSA
jgi:hypothetical protein